MTTGTLIRRSLWHYRRAHLGVVAGAATAAAVLIGALAVGDSVRHTLRRQGMDRLGRVHLAAGTPDRFFRAALAQSVSDDLSAPVAPVLLLRGAAGAEDNRVGDVQIAGVDRRFWQLSPSGKGPVELTGDEVALNRRLADRLGVAVGATLPVRLAKPAAFSRDAPLTTTTDASTGLRLTVRAIVDADDFGRFSLQANQIAPYGLFVPLDWLGERIDRAGKANLLLIGGDAAATVEKATAALGRHWRLDDAERVLAPAGESGWLELRSPRVFLDDATVRSAADARAGAVGVLTYLVNGLRAGERVTPYSMVSAVGPLHAPATAPAPKPEGVAARVPPDMAEDEIIVNDWLAKDLAVKAGDPLTLTYYVLGPMRRLVERSRTFRVRAVVPIEGAAADRTLMPEFPGVTDAANCADWDPGFDLDLGRIRPRDEDYWDKYRGTPKAFVSLPAGQQMWANRFGDFTAVRWPAAADQRDELAGQIRRRLGPASAGLSVQDVRAAAAAASSEAMDFGGLFLSLSFFLISSAVLLMGLLFVFGIQQRSAQVGTLSALGWETGRIRRALLAEGALVAVVGVAIGVPLGLAYTRAMLAALSGVWRGAVAGAAIRFHAAPLTVAAGAAGSLLIAAGAMWIVLRRQARAAPHELLAGTVEMPSGPPRRRRWLLRGIVFACTVAAVVIMGLFGTGRDPRTAGAFFAAGVLLLTAFLAAGKLWLSLLASAAQRRVPGVGVLAMRNAARRSGRSLAVMALLACGSFLVVSVGAFWVDPTAAARRRSSGTGGFALMGTAAIPLFEDPNTEKGLREMKVPPDRFAGLAGVRFVPIRVREGDDASCLNLNRAQRPQLLGVNPAELAQRKAFRFVQAAEGFPIDRGWSLLDEPADDGAAPGIADENTVVWGLHKKVGDTIDYTDEQGEAFRVRIVAVIANSILQGNLLISERAFIERFPSQAGYRMFLIDAPAGRAEEVRRTLAAAGVDMGLELTTAVERLAEFSQVQNTYLSIFQALGGLGLILGSVGMGVVVMRNVLERRGELALMQAVGYPRPMLHRLLLTEHGALLLAGLAFGVVAAIAAVWPALRSGGADIPYALLAALLAGVVIAGLAFTWLATRAALSGPLIPALRNE